MKGGNSGQNADEYGNTPGRKLVNDATWRLIKGTQV